MHRLSEYSLHMIIKVSMLMMYIVYNHVGGINSNRPASRQHRQYSQDDYRDYEDDTYGDEVGVGSGSGGSGVYYTEPPSRGRANLHYEEDDDILEPSPYPPQNITIINSHNESERFSNNPQYEDDEYNNGGGVVQSLRQLTLEERERDLEERERAIIEREQREQRLLERERELEERAYQISQSHSPSRRQGRNNPNNPDSPDIDHDNLNNPHVLSLIALINPNTLVITHLQVVSMRTALSEVAHLIRALLKQERVVPEAVPVRITQIIFPKKHPKNFCYHTTK